MQKLSPYELAQNPFTLIGKQWTLITTKAANKTNAMTASWGGVGILWNKPVATVYIRPQRFTQEVREKSERFSLCFLDDAFRKEYSYCGSASGRDQDKMAACGFTEISLDGAPAIGQSELILTCRKLYCQRFTPESFLDPCVDTANYPNHDYHYMYIGEILGAYQK